MTQRFQSLQELVLRADSPNLDVFFGNSSFTLAELVRPIIQETVWGQGWRQEQARVCLPGPGSGTHVCSKYQHIWLESAGHPDLFDIKTLPWLEEHVRLEQNNDS